MVNQNWLSFIETAKYKIWCGLTFENVFNLCEIKFTQNVFVFTEAEAHKIRQKAFFLRTKIKEKQSIFPKLISPFGAKKNMYYLGLI